MNKYILSILLLIFSYGVYAVGVKQCLFSDMTGVVNFEGKPAAGVKLVRMVDYNKKQYDETITDENGNFHFPAVFRNNYAAIFLPMEFVVGQQIMAHKDGKEYEMWSGVKRRPEENAEARGKPLIVECELSLEEMNHVSVDFSSIHSRCTWDVKSDPKIIHVFQDDNGNNTDIDGYLVDDDGNRLVDENGKLLEGSYK